MIQNRKANIFIPSSGIKFATAAEELAARRENPNYHRVRSEMWSHYHDHVRNGTLQSFTRTSSEVRDLHAAMAGAMEQDLALYHATLSSSSSSSSSAPASSAPAACTLVSEHHQTVERVVDTQFDDDDQLSYEVKWVGLSAQHNCWFHASVLHGLPGGGAEALERYERHQARSIARPRRARPTTFRPN